MKKLNKPREPPKFHFQPELHISTSRAQHSRPTQLTQRQYKHIQTSFQTQRQKYLRKLQEQYSTIFATKIFTTPTATYLLASNSLGYVTIWNLSVLVCFS